LFWEILGTYQNFRSKLTSWYSQYFPNNFIYKCSWHAILYFKIIMQSNVVAIMEAPFHANPLTQLWQIFEASRILWHSFLEFFKLAKIAVVQIMGLVEDEQTFFTLSFMKFKLRNHFNEHFNNVVGMYFQTLTIWIFSHMTHVLKIERSRSPCEHWIRLFYWDLGGVCCCNPIINGPSQWWHLTMVKVRSFCHLEVKIQALWWLFNVVCVCFHCQSCFWVCV